MPLIPLPSVEVSDEMLEVLRVLEEPVSPVRDGLGGKAWFDCHNRGLISDYVYDGWMFYALTPYGRLVLSAYYAPAKVDEREKLVNDVVSAAREVMAGIDNGKYDKLWKVRRVLELALDTAEEAGK